MKRNIGKKHGMLAVFICVLMLTACGGKTEGNLNENTNVPENSNEQEANTEKGMEESTATDADEETTSEDTVEQNSEMEERSGTEETNEQAATSNTASVSGTQKIEGDIESIDDYNFVINQIFTKKTEDGGDVAYQSKDNKTQIHVRYTDQTVFIICTSTDGGMTSENEDGTKEDLNKGQIVLLDGEWDGNDFNAQKVTIYHFE